MCVADHEPSQPSICFVTLLLLCAGCHCMWHCQLRCFCPCCAIHWGEVLLQVHCPLSSYCFKNCSFITMLLKKPLCSSTTGWFLFWCYHLPPDPSVCSFLCFTSDCKCFALSGSQASFVLLWFSSVEQRSMATISKCCFTTCSWEEWTEIVMLWFYLC